VFSTLSNQQEEIKESERTDNELEVKYPNLGLKFKFAQGRRELLFFKAIKK
jgi:hypothetical protein